MHGDRDALRSLWHANRGWVATILLAHKPRQADLDDLLQTVAMALVRTIHTVRDEQAFKPWLRTVATNAARAAGRRQKTESRVKLVDAEPASEMEEGAREQAQRVMELARQLPDGYREPLLLRCVKGMSYREIAQVLEIPETTIETRIARGRRMLRELALGDGHGNVEVVARGKGVVDV
jgi:RNA polymerase sigma-70 factor (ECF subfamily)